MAMITNEINQINMLHRIGNAFGWRLEVHQNGEAINLSAYDIEWYITDVRGNTLLSATVGDGLALSVDETQLIFDTPISALDPLEQTAYAYEVHILDPMGNTPLIRGKFKVVKPLHLAAIEAAIVEDENLIQVIQSAEPTVIKIDGNTVFGLELKADLVNGKVPASQLPSFVDDVVEYANLAAFPTTGEASKIYVTLDTNLTYRWTGTAYVQISESTAIWGQISGNIALQTDLQTVFTSINASIASKYDNSNPAGYITSADLNGYATQNWVNAQGFALASSLSGYVPYTGATTSLNLGTNNLLFGTATGSGRIKLPDAGTTSADGIAFGDYFIFRSGLQTLSLNSGSATWTFNNAIFSAPTNQSSTFRIGGTRTLTFDNGLGGTIMSLNSSSGTTTIRGNSASTGSVALFQNSAPTDIMNVYNNGRVGIGAGFTPSVALECNTTIRAWNQLEVGQFASIVINNSSFTKTVSGSDYFTFNNQASFNASSGSYYFLRLSSGVAVSGSASVNILPIVGTINQAAGATGTIRGIFLNHTFTNAIDYRAIEVITGNNAAHTLIKLNNGAQDVFCVKGNNQAGFFGKITGQASMPTATAGATYTAAEQTMLQAVYNAVRDFGIGN